MTAHTTTQPPHADGAPDDDARPGDLAKAAPGEPAVDPADFATFLRVMDQVAVLPQTHPQHAAARRASSALFKAAKKHGVEISAD